MNPGLTRTELILLVAAAVISVCGLAEATYLTVSHLTGETLLCGGSFDCSQVLASKYAVIGPIPVAALGALAYFTAFSCAIFAAFEYRGARQALTVTALAMLAATLWLIYVQAFLLHTFCRYCLFSAALIFFLNGINIMIPNSPNETLE
jgi:vitamin-K-epoxide reductase (warfarin-sensitive)